MPAQKLRGFTLIELMIVVSIIAILAAIGMVVYSGAEKSARDGKRISDIQEIQKGLEQYYSINGQYPPNITAISGSGNIGGYFQSGAAPTDPQTTNAYNYVLCSTNKAYNLCAVLENSSNSSINSSGPSSDGCSSYLSPNSTPSPSGSASPSPSGNTSMSQYCVKQLSN